MTLHLNVVSKQGPIQFGADTPGSSNVDEFEVDEVSLRKKDLGNNKVQWHEYVGGKRRGDRSSLVLEQRPAKRSQSSYSQNGRAVPPPMTKPEWKNFRKRRV